MKKNYLLLFVTVITALFTTPKAYALEIPDANNDILFYSEKAVSGCSNATGELVGNDNLEKIYNYFISQGLSPEQAAGVVGNIAQESKGDPTIVEGGNHTEDPSGVSGGWGIIQWTPGSKVLGIAKQAGITGDISKLETQLQVVWWHMTTQTPTGVANFIEQYKTVTDVRAATDLYEKKMEAAGIPNMANRYAAAELALSTYGKGSSTTTSSGKNCGGGAVAGSAIETAKNYAWPKYEKLKKEKKPEYEAAIQKAKSEGGFVGDSCYGGGVDCGAFVTRVMQDSGADPEYNPEKNNTSAQLNYAMNSPKYEKVDPGDVKPGDIAIRPGHTYLYIGEVEGFETQVASASQCDHAPMSAYEGVGDPSYSWFRLKGGSKE